MQTRLTIFDQTPSKAELTCKRIIGYCNRPEAAKRIGKMISIREILKETL